MQHAVRKNRSFLRVSFINFAYENPAYICFYSNHETIILKGFISGVKNQS